MLALTEMASLTACQDSSPTGFLAREVSGSADVIGQVAPVVLGNLVSRAQETAFLDSNRAPGCQRRHSGLSCRKVRHREQPSPGIERLQITATSWPGS